MHSLKKKIEKYDDMTVPQKIKTHPLLVSELNKTHNIVNALLTTIENPSEYVSRNAIDIDSEMEKQERFKLTLNRIEVLRQSPEENMTLNAKIDRYLELHDLIEWARNYMQEQKMEVFDA